MLFPNTSRVLANCSYSYSFISISTPTFSTTPTPLKKKTYNNPMVSFNAISFNSIRNFESVLSYIYCTILHVYECFIIYIHITKPLLQVHYSSSFASSMNNSFYSFYSHTIIWSKAHMLKTYHDYANAIETNQFRISDW